MVRVESVLKRCQNLLLNRGFQSQKTGYHHDNISKCFAELQSADNVNWEEIIIGGHSVSEYTHRWRPWPPPGPNSRKKGELWENGIREGFLVF